MLPPGESQWVCRRDRHTDEQTPDRYITLCTRRGQHNKQPLHALNWTRVYKQGHQLSRAYVYMSNGDILRINSVCANNGPRALLINAVGLGLPVNAVSRLHHGIYAVAESCQVSCVAVTRLTIGINCKFCNYFAPGSGTEYCNQRVCVSICLMHASCLYVCLFARIFKNMYEYLEIFCTCYL